MSRAYLSVNSHYRHRGQIPLWFAGVLLALLITAVGIWTWASTRGQTADGRIPIVFWNANNLGDEVYSAIHQFEVENPKYKVIASTSASPDLTGDSQRLLCAIAGKVPPDLVWFDRFAIGEWAGRGALTDITPYLEKQDPADPDRIDLSQYYPFALDEARYSPPGSGQAPRLYGLPTSLDIRVLYSNANQLRQAGKVDESGRPLPPQNWDELRSYAKDLTRHNPDGSIARLGFAPNFGNSWLYMYAFQMGGHLLSPDGTRVTMDSPEVVTALKYMTDVYDDLGGYTQVDGFQSGFQSGILDPFIKGQVSMKIDGDWGMQTIAENAPDFEFGITPAPTPIDSQTQKPRPPVTWAGGFSMVIPSTAQQKEGAFKLMQFISSRRTYRFLEEGNRQTAESKGRLYLPRLQSNRVLIEAQIGEFVDSNKRMPPSFKNAYVVLKDLLPKTLIRPPSPVGQLLWIQHIHAYEEAVNHKLKDAHPNDEVGEITECLKDSQVEVQRRLDAITQPLPPHEVHWGVYFVLYSILIVVPFIAIYVALLRNRRTRIYRRGETASAMIFLSPWLIGLICLTAGPILFSIVMSFSRYDVLSDARYVGWQNYRDMFADGLFRKSLLNTAFMLLRIPLGMAASLAIAMLLNRKLTGIGGYRTAFYMPVVVPVVACTLLWQALLNNNFGLLNVALRWVFSTAPFHGIEWAVNHLHHFEKAFAFTAPQWLEDPAWTKPSLILMGLWSAGGGMIIWLAGLQAIPQQLYEAATVDGASKWKQFLNVTVPMLSPYILFNAIVGVIGTMQIFSEAYIMFPNGGNDDSTLFYAFYLFRQSFQYFSMGYASAMAWILFLIVLALTLIQLYLSKKWVHYDQT